MFIGTIIEKIIGWRKTQKEKKSAMMEKKLGLMGKHQFHYQYDVLWPDKDFSGLGWQVLVLETPETVFLREPVCLKCKTNLVTRTNKTCEGFYLECTDCKEKFEVDDIGLARSIAESSLQGEARRNPRKFFSGY
jgi:hypothetical protein